MHITLKKTLSGLALLALILLPSLSQASGSPLKNSSSSFTHLQLPTEKDDNMTMGMDMPFDHVELSLDPRQGVKLLWSYRNVDGIWKPLSVQDTSPEFGSTVSVAFNPPSDWGMSNLFTEYAYWIRVRLDDSSEVESTDVLETGTQAYPLTVVVENEQGNRLTFLNEDNFSVSGGTDNKIYGVINQGNGVYALSLQTEAADTDYFVSVKAPGHYQKGVYVNDINGKTAKAVTIQLKFDVDCNTPYADLEYHWGEPQIRELYCQSIIDEETPSEEAPSFHPNGTMSRADFLKLAFTGIGISTDRYKNYDEPFKDVTKDPYVTAAYQMGYLTEANVFRPDDAITRAEAVSIMVRIAGAKTATGVAHFKDVHSDDWFYQDVQTAYSYNIVQGYEDKTFRPNNGLSKAEATTIVGNAIYNWFKF